MKSELIVADLPTNAKKSWKLIGEIPTGKNLELKNYPPLVQKLLARRGIFSAESAEQYLNPDYLRDIHDPFLMLDMEVAV